MRRTLLLAAGLLLALSAAAQTVTNQARLLELARQFEDRFQARRGPQFQRLRAMTAGLQGAINRDPDVELMGVTEEGRLILYGVENADAAATLRVDNLHPGGSSGLELTGSGTFDMGIWDGGRVRETHQELAGRVMNQNGGATHYHATHVAGTMIAAGVVPSAKGMSPEAWVQAWDWANDVSEMATAAANGLHISNHSYGPRAGWNYNSSQEAWYWLGDVSLSTTEDYAFGFYDGICRAWDQVAYNAPFYTIVRSAGNDRGDGPSPGSFHYVNIGGSWQGSTEERELDGGDDEFDCINYGKVAKNIITVGAVNDVLVYNGPQSVNMSSFSNWGPADDGRIKPDLVANGVDLYSTMDDNDAAYSSLSGTSMSAPNLSGSLALLLRLYERSHGDGMLRSSTIKALVTHTTDEAGDNPGPDYSYGWGLANIERAAEKVLADSMFMIQIQEHVLGQGDTLRLPYRAVEDQPLRATIAWTDPAAQVPPPALNDRTPMLVNDLDLRLVHTPTGAEHQPWTLDPDNPSAGAVPGDNVVDNVEQVYVAAPDTGAWELVVSHKDSLENGVQAFGLVLSGLAWPEDPRIPPRDLTAALDTTSGQVELAWTLPERDETFENFLVYRDGDLVATTTDTFATDLLPDFGRYSWSVAALWADGESPGPVNPTAAVWWPRPVPPLLLDVNVVDEEAGLVRFHWDHLRPAPSVFDDSTAESYMYLGDTAPDSSLLAKRLTAAGAGRLHAVEVVLEEAEPAPLGPLRLAVHSALPGDTVQPGEELWSTEVFTPDSTGPLVRSLGGDRVDLAEGEDYWVVVEWVQVGHNPVGNDTQGPRHGRASIKLPGFFDWTPTDVALGGLFNGNPLIRGRFGLIEPPPVNGFRRFHLLRDGDLVGETPLLELEETVPGDALYEYSVRAVYQQGTVDGPSLLLDGSTLLGAPEAARPLATEIGAAYPNPFNPVVSVGVSLAERAPVRMVVYDLLGRRVAEIAPGALAPGRHQLRWNGSAAASGVYFLRVEAGRERALRKVVLMK